MEFPWPTKLNRQTKSLYSLFSLFICIQDYEKLTIFRRKPFKYFTPSSIGLYHAWKTRKKRKLLLSQVWAHGFHRNQTKICNIRLTNILFTMKHDRILPETLYWLHHIGKRRPFYHDCYFHWTMVYNLCYSPLNPDELNLMRTYCMSNNNQWDFAFCCIILVSCWIIPREMTADNVTQ